ncbi:MAG: glycosyltransferase [Candidatus Kapabacteria bacterium]|nr:glycosyltransferase [Candidatus Kapabacteria bacterium]
MGEDNLQILKRNVLVISYYFPPMGLSGVQRTLKFVKYLPENGWEPLILTSSSEAYYAFDETLMDEVPKPENIYRTKPDISRFAKLKSGTVMKYPSRFSKAIRSSISSVFFQPDSRSGWRKSAVALGRKILTNNPVHAIYASGPPYTDFLVAMELSKQFEIPFVIDYRDPWLDNPYYHYPSPFHKSYSQNLEEEVLKNTSKAVVTSRYVKELMLKRYRILSHEDIVIIPQGFDSNDFSAVEATEKNKDKFVITHTGTFGDDLTPKYFLKALASFLSKNKEAAEKVEARFAGVMSKSHQKLVKKFKLEKNIVNCGYLPHQQSIAELKNADVLWLMFQNKAMTPGRLFEYIGAQKPILICGPDGEMKRAALASKAAIDCPPNDIKAIEKAISIFYEKWQSDCLPKISSQYASNFDRRLLTADLARELSLVALY